MKAIGEVQAVGGANFVERPTLLAFLDVMTQAPSVEEAVLTLKQGFGRLIRSLTDRGVLMLLDPRIRTTRYGKIFLDSLPAYRRTTDIPTSSASSRHPRASCVCRSQLLMSLLSSAFPTPLVAVSIRHVSAVAVQKVLLLSVPVVWVTAALAVVAQQRQRTSFETSR